MNSDRCTQLAARYASLLRKPEYSDLSRRLEELREKYRQAAQMEPAATINPSVGYEQDKLIALADRKLRELDNELGEVWLSSLSEFERQLFDGREETEIEEMLWFMDEWSPGSFTEVAESIIYHAPRKGYTDYLEYLRAASNFDKFQAVRIPPQGFRDDDTVRWKMRNNGEYLVEDKDGKIRTYGFNRE